MPATNSQISRWAATYENELCAKYNLIATRVSIQITAGISEYELPNYITNIRMILYKGSELLPKSFTNAVNQNNAPVTTDGRSTPFEYVFSGKGLRVIKLYPTPGENIPAYVGDLWTPEADRTGFIVEAYRTAPSGTEVRSWGDLEQFTWGSLEQYTWGNLFNSSVSRLPTWFRRYTLKSYIAMKAFSVEGPDQDIKASLYYSKNKLPFSEAHLLKVKENLFKFHVNVLNDTQHNGRIRPGRPVLPSNFPVR